MSADLTARGIAALKPRADRYIVRDAKVSGLELRVCPDGRKLWTLRYRNTAKEQRRMNLGEHPRVGLAAARKRANAELRKVDGGIDPQAERQEAKRALELAKANSIEALCKDYIERHARVKKRTWRDDQIKIKGEILTAWKGRAVSSITRRDCRTLVQAIADRPAPILANRVVALLSRLFRFAVDDELIQANPAAHLPKPGVEAQARPDGEREQKAYTADEIRSIWQATEKLSPALRATYRLGLLTGQRPNEITGMTWGEMDGAWWTIPGRRTKRPMTMSSPAGAASGSLQPSTRRSSPASAADRSRAMRYAIPSRLGWPRAASPPRTSRRCSITDMVRPSRVSITPMNTTAKSGSRSPSGHGR
jgi:integrase